MRSRFLIVTLRITFVTPPHTFVVRLWHELGLFCLPKHRYGLGIEAPPGSAMAVHFVGRANDEVPEYLLRRRRICLSPLGVPAELGPCF